ncbi:MAG: hypothetical protein WCR07_08040 [Verrucomicrobiota bacterium]|jgi:hypothetical protein
MKFHHLALAAAVAASLHGRLAADIIVPGANGSDGALTITNNTVIDLSLAPTGVWNTNTASSSPNFRRGTYDPAKWAVVFKYSSVSIRSNATVTFKNHPSRAPVVWLVSSNVVIETGSSLVLSGQDSHLTVRATLAEPGPGGFRGGAEYLGQNAGSGPGFGPGGGDSGGYNLDWTGRSAGHGAPASHWTTPGVYGNPSLLPLVGGAGGGGAFRGDGSGGGGAGGGAILIAAQSSVMIRGSIQSNGGRGIARDGFWDGRGNGSGGGIRLVAEFVQGGGTVEAMGGANWNSGGAGRLRVERVSTDGAMTFNPPSPSVVPLQSGDTAVLWVPDSGPSVRVVSIGGKATPADPRAEFGATGADISLAQTATVAVVVETTNVEDASKVKVRMMPRANGQLVEKDAVLSQVVSNSPKVIRWTVDMPVNGGYAAIQARVIRP